MGNSLRAVHRPFDRRRIRKYLGALGWEPDLVVLFQLPVRHDLLAMFPKATTAYYCSDIYGFGEATPGELQEEEACCRKVDLIFTTSEVLKNRLVRFNPRTYHIPHAVDRDWWESGSGQSPPEFSGIPKPRCVFTGAVFERLDFDLLLKCAQLRKDWQFVLVGPVIRDSSEIQQLRGEKNVSLLGHRAWEAIPGYLNGADVLMVPFRRNPVAENLGLPLKFYEYAMSGKPILSTDFGPFEFPDPSLAVRYQTAQEWSDYLEYIASSPSEEAKKAERRRSIALENTYESRLELQRAAFRSLQERGGDREVVP
ncbi:glycosyltransferase [bacterium]|nr:glycosyltransferase [bacterium]